MHDAFGSCARGYPLRRGGCAACGRSCDARRIARARTCTSHQEPRSQDRFQHRGAAADLRARSGVSAGRAFRDSNRRIEVRAEAAHVWKAIVQMETIEEPLLLAHRLGLAYPVRGRVFGAGVGALRYGDFSTGTAIERVTEWVENRKLTFVVLKDVPGLRELSPYRHVHAPHVHRLFHHPRDQLRTRSKSPADSPKSWSAPRMN